MRRRKWFLSLLPVMAAHAAALPEDPAGLLGRIRQAVARNLSELPNYTCQQTIERSMRRSGSRDYTPLDKVRLEVAYVGGRELFGWPGAGKFEEKRIDEIVGGNRAIGNGFFAAHARAVFLSGTASFTYSGEVERNGRKCLRFEYQVPRAKSEFVFRDGTRAATAGYAGSFWVDAETLDLLRLEIRVDEFPPSIAAKHSSDALEYARVPIAGREFLLPQLAEMNITDLYGNQSRNVTKLAACRQYIGQSVLKFEEASAPDASAAPKPAAAIALPEGLEIETVLATPLAGNPAIGDPVIARVARDAKKEGKILVPKGATVSGRITRFEKRRTRGFDYLVLGIAFYAFEAQGIRGEFAASIERVGAYGNQYHAPLSHGVQAFSVWSGLRAEFPDLRPGEGLILVRGEALRLMSGVPLSLLVVPPDDGLRRP